MYILTILAIADLEKMMDKYEIIKIAEHSEWLSQAAEWFHQKWQIPKSAYLESMEASLKNHSVIPQ